MGEITRRDFLIRSAAGLLAAGGCGDGERAPASRERAPPGASDPVECEGRSLAHKYGRTRIPGLPDRVVSLTERDQDTALALGVAPVAIRDGYYRIPYLERPWVPAALADAGPTLLPRAGELPFERIAALEPGLILATASGISGRDYGILSRIAPTVAQSGEYADYGVPWQEIAAVVGRALCRQERAAARVAEARAALAAARERHPGVNGATAAVALPGGPDGSYWLYGPQDTRVRFLASLGLALPAEIADLAGDRFAVTVSAERMDLLEVDVLLWLASPEQRAALERDPVYRRLRVAREGRDLFLRVDGLVSAALTNASLLSVPFLADELAPRLAAALEGRSGDEASDG